jgi:hypothetical protein
MPARIRVSHRSFLAVAVVVLAVVPASAASAAPKAQVTIGPLTAPAGAAAEAASAVLANPAGAERIGSADLQPPPGFRVVSATLTGTGRATLSAGKVQLRNLDLRAGGSISVAMTLEVPCDTGLATGWTTPVKRSTTFSGADLGISALSSTTTDVRGECTLVWDRQPASARIAQDITSVRYGGAGTPAARVAVLDGDGNRIAAATGDVTLRFGSKAGGGALSQTSWALSAPDGYASFAGLRISDAGTYALEAEVTRGRFAGIDPARSDTFRMDDRVEVCASGAACPPGQLSRGAASFSVDAVAGQSLAYLTLSAEAGIQLDEFDCPGWTPFTGSTALFSVTPDAASAQRAKTISVTVSKTAMNAVSDNGSPRLEICFASPERFTAKRVDGTLVEATRWPGRFDWDANGTADDVYTGLLPDCPRAGQACIIQRKKVPSGQGYIQGSVPASLVDPAMRT